MSVIDVWRPRKTEGIVSHYTLHKGEINHGYKIRYTCDFQYCNNRSKIHTTHKGSLDKSKLCNWEKQICRSCRTFISERERKTIIPFSEIKKSLESEGYKVFSTESEYFYSRHPSQFPINVECPNRHRTQVIWNNWKNQGKRCRKCYLEKTFQTSLQGLSDFQTYKFLVLYFTQKTWRKYKNQINPYKYKRARTGYHLDHKFSITEGFRSNILPRIMGSKNNLELIPYDENIRKNKTCSITKEELFNEYFG